MGRPRTVLLDSSPCGNVTADTLLTCWKQSFEEPSNGWEGDPVVKAQAELGRREFQPCKPEICRKFAAGGHLQEKGLHKYLPQKNEVHEKDKKLQKSKVSPSSFMAILKACTEQKDLQRGAELHAYIVSSGLFKKSIAISASLECFFPNSVTYVYILKAFLLGWAKNVFRDVAKGRMRPLGMIAGLDEKAIVQVKSQQNKRRPTAQKPVTRKTTVQQPAEQRETSRSSFNE
ncbi:hypothetical protein GOP47_0015752 [Adiantum capillus-veneris]|uniref:Uncharacterized protein n=1 Tax=Adiantum capillus-veneris TaxID=13818 RepID=A0A9D4UL66_ADICA|nr:hypothetical protein GOP47_0015752 [Adiantum capillus-veneris]